MGGLVNAAVRDMAWMGAGEGERLEAEAGEAETGGTVDG